MNRIGMRMPFISVLLLIVFSGSLPLQAENIRGNIAGILDRESNSTSFMPENIVVIQSDNVGEFQEGMELRIQIPQGLHQYQNSFAMLIYREVTPSPELDRKSYAGSRAYMRLLPSRNSTFIRIPFTEIHGITGDALTDVLPVAITADQFPLIFTILPVMKGIPDSAFREELSVSVVPIWQNQGSLTINVTNLSGNPDEKITVMIDGKPRELDQAVILTAGIHRVRVASTHAPTVEKTIAIEPGKAMKLDLTLDYRPPELTVSVPEGARLFLDGSEITVKDPVQILAIEPGTHVVSYSLGNVEINRSFTIRPGGQVKIDLIIDISIVEFGDGAGSEYGAGDG